MTNEAPLPLSREQIRAVQDWAADDRLWSTKETTEFNLYTFARLILKLAGNQPSTEVSSSPAASSAQKENSSIGLSPPHRTEEKDHGAALLRVDQSAVVTTEALPISVPVTTEELEWVLHAASLRHLTLVEYVRRAINLSLRLRQSDDEDDDCREAQDNTPSKGPFTW